MSTGASYGYSQQPSYGMGGMGGYGGMYGSYNPYAQMGGYGSMYGGFSPYGGMGGYGMSANPYQSLGFGGGYGGFGGGMGGYNPFGGYGQVGLGYLPPQQPTINDAVANQFMQQYYGGAFGLGGQPQPRRQRPRNPFRNPLEAEPYAMPSQKEKVTSNYPVGASPPSGVLQPAVMPDYRTGPEGQVDQIGRPTERALSFINPQPSVVNPLPESFYRRDAIDPSLLAELSYLRF